MLADPTTPDGGNLNAMRQAVGLFDSYRIKLSEATMDRTARGQQATEDLKMRYKTVMAQLVSANPALNMFWSSVLEPESSLQ